MNVVVVMLMVSLVLPSRAEAGDAPTLVTAQASKPRVVEVVGGSLFAVGYAYSLIASTAALMPTIILGALGYTEAALFSGGFALAMLVPVVGPLGVGIAAAANGSVSSAAMLMTVASVQGLGLGFLLYGLLTRAPMPGLTFTGHSVAVAF